MIFNYCPICYADVINEDNSIYICSKDAHFGITFTYYISYFSYTLLETPSYRYEVYIDLKENGELLFQGIYQLDKNYTPRHYKQLELTFTSDIIEEQMQQLKLFLAFE